MAEGTPRLRFQVLDEDSGKKVMLQFNDYTTFEQKCKQKFGYPLDADVDFVLEDAQDVELDESVFECCDDRTKFRMRRKFGVTTTSDITDTVDAYDQTQRKGVTTASDIADTVDAYDQDTQRKEPLVSTSSTDKGEDTENAGKGSGTGTCDNTSDIENASDEFWSSPKVEMLTSGADYIREEMKKRGKEKLGEILQEAENLPLAPLNICVTGSSGQGKSKLINTLRNVSPGDDGYAPVGTIETTAKCTGYPHPHHQNIVFWDVPGVGTIDVKREEYLSKIEFQKYDFFLICSSTRFTDDDAWLAKEVKKQKKRFYYLRTKVDQDTENAKMELHGNFDEKIELYKIKKNCLMNTTRLGHHKVPVFLISSVRKNEYDFPGLSKMLIDDAPAEQQRSLTYGLVSVSEDMIALKAKYLKADIWKTAMLSALGGAVPIPGASAFVDMTLILERLHEYRRELQLTAYDMKTYAKMVSLPENVFKQAVGLKIDYVLLLSPQGGKFVMSTLTMGAIVEETTRYVPVIGTTVAAGVSYWATGKVLKKFLDDMVNDAKQIHAFVAMKQANRNQVAPETHGM